MYGDIKAKGFDLHELENAPKLLALRSVCGCVHVCACVFALGIVAVLIRTTLTYLCDTTHQATAMGLRDRDCRGSRWG